MLASRVSALFSHLGNRWGQERWENGEPESWSAPVGLQSFQTSVLAVVIVLIKDKSTSSKVDCTSEWLLLSLMELAWIRLYPCCLGLLHCNMEFSLSGAVSQLWDRVLCFLVFQFRESEIVITEIEMVINYKYLLSVQDLVEQCCFAFSKLYLNQPLNRMDWLLQDGLSRNWTKLAVWVVLGKSATNYKEMFFIIKYFFNHFQDLGQAIDLGIGRGGRILHKDSYFLFLYPSQLLCLLLKLHISVP